MTKRIISMILACLLLCTSIPYSALATQLQTWEMTETVTAEATEPVQEPETTEPAEQQTQEPVLTVTQTTVTQTPANAVVTASGTCGENVTWELDDTGTLTVSGTGAMTNYTQKGSPFYENRKNIKRAIIEPGITEIGSYAFYYTSWLEEVSLPDTLVAIGESAFDCSGLNEIHIPTSLKRIGAAAFSAAYDLRYVYITDMAHWCEIEFASSTANPLYDHNSKREYLYLNGVEVKDLVIPEGTTKIGSMAFVTYKGLTSVTIPKSVTEIGSQAFYYCSNLKSMHFAGAPAKIANTFDRCNALQEVHIEDIAAWCQTEFAGDLANPLSVAGYLYMNGEKVTELTIPEGVTKISAKAFSGCRNITGITFPKSLTEIGSEAFYTCPLKTITVPAGLSAVGENAFGNNSVARSVYIEDLAAWCKIRFADAGANPMYTTASAGSNLYLNGTQVTALTIPDSITQIGNYAFYDCSLTGVTFPGTLTQLGDYAFAYCIKISQLALPGSLQTVGTGVFYGCSGLSTVTFDKGITAVGSGMFNYCKGLETVKLASTVTTIAPNAFANCTELDTISMPAGVQAVGEKAFYNCSQLDLVIFKGEAPTIGSSAFYNAPAVISYPEKTDAWKESARYDYGGTLIWYCAAEGAGGTFSRFNNIQWTLKDDVLTITGEGHMNWEPYKEAPWKPYRAMIRKVVVGSGIDNLYTDAFAGCYALTEVVLNPDLGHIYNRVFANCTSLKQITLPESVVLNEAVFQGCAKLESITIPKNTDILYGSVFSGCKSLKSLVIPGTVEKVYGAFISGCTSLKAVYFTGDMPYFSNESGYVPTFSGWTGIVLYPVDNKTWTKTKINELENRYKDGNVLCLPNDGTNNPQLRAESEPTTGLPLLVWNPIDGIDRYEVWRATGKTGQYTLVITVEQNAVLDMTAAGGQTYYYKVRGICDKDASKNTGYSRVASAGNRCATPLLDGGWDEATGKLKFVWTEVTGAAKYEVWRSTSDEGKYTKVATVTKPTYTDSKAAVGKEYYYKVKAVASNSAYNSEFSNILYGCAIYPQPKLKVTLDSKTAKPSLSWGKVSGAKYYLVARRLADGEEYEGISVQKGTTFVDTQAEVDVAYVYVVQAWGEEEGLESYPSNEVTAAAACAKPATPKASYNQNGKPIITWTAVDGAVGYKVYRSTSSSKSYTLVATVTEPTYLDESVAAGKSYYYKVSTLGKNSESGQSAYVKATGKCDIPTLTVQTGSTGKPVLTWNKITGAKKYEIHRSINGGAFKKLTTVTKLTYTDTKATEGAECTYKVKALGSSSSYNGQFSETGSCYVTCAAPTLTVNVDTASGKPNLSWKKVTGAVSYAIYRSVNGGEYEQLTTVTTLTYKDTDTSADNQYSYYVVSLGKSEVFNSVPSSTKTVTVAVGQPKLTGTVNDNGKPVITWAAVEDAVLYKIYRSTSSSKSYKEIASGAELSYTDPSVAAGKTYYYKVVAVGANSESAQSAYVKLTGKCDIPVLTVEAGSTGKPVLTWNKISGASKYEIHRSVDGGAFTKLTTTTKTTYTDTKAEGGQCTYKIKALGSKSSYNGNFSEVAGCYVALAAPSVTVKLDTSGSAVISWNKVTGATGYTIYRAINNGDYEELTTVTTTSYTDEEVGVGNKNSYTVVALGKEAVYNSARSAAKSVSRACAAPKLTGEFGYSRRPVLTWEPVDGAMEYAIYRSTKKSSGFKKIETTPAAGYMDTTAPTDKTYYYKVTALGGGSESAMSNVVSVKAVDPYTPLNQDPGLKIVAGGHWEIRNVFWEITSDGVLTFAGNGTMRNGANYPWRKYTKYYTKVVIGDELTNLAPSAFSGLTNITDVHIGSSMKVIEEAAFAGCDGITTLLLPQSLEEIGVSAFAGCDNLILEYAPGCKLHTIGESAFSSSGITEFIAPENLRTIGDKAFQQCQKLETVVLTGRVKTVGIRAFMDSRNIKRLVLGESITELGGLAFYGCKNLEYLEYSCNGYIDFSFQTKLKTLVIGGARTTSGDFFGCTALKEVIIEAPLVEINGGAFNQSSVKHIELPDTVVTIGANAFSRSGITELIVPASVKSVGVAAFAAETLTEITFLGDLPEVTNDLCFHDTTALTVYYPKDNPTWTEAARNALDKGNVTWVAQ
jgi:fibronectin type 3 domain-containing protein